MGERSCVNVFGLVVERSLLRAIMGISAHSFSLAERPVMAIRVTSSRMRLQTLFHRQSVSQTSVGSSLC
jgi:hypothetical protein